MTNSETDKSTPAPAHEGRFAPGQVIAGRFTVVRYIARGGMGEVYEVEDRFLQKVHVALKIILPQIAGDTSSSHRFEQEVLLARKVVHPNLCPIYDIARCDDPPPAFLCLTMKLIEGETLSARLKRTPQIPREQVIAIVRQLVAGLAAIHAAGIIHRDIKPNNVMLDTSGPELCVIIMDFGLARLSEAETTIASQSLMAGALGFMAPEVLRGEGPSQAADLFALGVVLHQLLTGEYPRFKPLSLAFEPSAKLAKADAPPVFIHAVKEFLSSEPNRRCAAFEELKATLSITSSGQHWTAQSRPGMKRVSRRQFVIGSAIAAGAVAGGVMWKWDRVYDLMHPLPAKRFVALVGWPLPVEDRLKATISSVVDAIGSELARAEAFDHDFLIIPRNVGKDVTSLSQLNEVREAVGANLVLAASGSSRPEGFQLLLRLYDPATPRMLREKSLVVPPEAQLQLPEMAVRTAAEVLSIARYQPDDQRSKVGTTNAEAYAAFQAAENLRKQDNDAGLDAAIDKYKEAIEADPRYADAQSRLGWAYLRLYGLRRDPGALGLASLNLKSAISFDPDLADAHVGLASYYQQTGDEDGKSREIAKALALDPTNVHTLTYQADFYADENRWDEAEATFKRVLNLRPNYWLAHNELAAVLEDEGKYPQALMEFHSASLLAPKNAFALKTLGSVYLKLGRISEAVDSLQASLAMNPSDKAVIALAEAFRLQQKYPEAIDFAQRAVKMNSKEPWYWIELGDVYSTTGKNGPDAAAAYARAATAEEDKLRTSPKNGPGWMLLALCRAKSGHAEIALELVAKAEQFHADDMDSQIAKVRTLELAGDRQGALTCMARCLSRGPTLFQFENLRDIEKLRASSEFKSMLATTDTLGHPSS